MAKRKAKGPRFVVHKVIPEGRHGAGPVDDEEADAGRRPVSTQPAPVRSGRTIEEVAAEKGAT
jgi:hypothetical protein